MALWTFQPDRRTLLAATATSIQPPVLTQTVLVGNGTPGDLRVYSDPNDEAKYFIVAAGYEKLLELRGANYFRPDQVAFYLKADQAGTAVLIWL